MARVDFYVLAQSGEQARQVFACRLAEKAYRLKKTVHIHAGTRADAEHIDDLLWTFRDGSFVPHHLTDTVTKLRSPVTIGSDAAAAESRDLLINLSDEVPDMATAFPRIAELVSCDDDCKQKSRARFAHYREQGHDIETHNL